MAHLSDFQANFCLVLRCLITHLCLLLSPPFSKEWSPPVQFPLPIIPPINLATSPLRSPRLPPSSSGMMESGNLSRTRTMDLFGCWNQAPNILKFLNLAYRISVFFSFSHIYFFHWRGSDIAPRFLSPLSYYIRYQLIHYLILSVYLDWSLWRPMLKENKYTCVGFVLIHVTDFIWIRSSFIRLHSFISRSLQLVTSDFFE